ncbi:MAG: hypothetical protein KAW03_07260 [Candidatus Lokiarchaeota archaeon]|nr:hypothetical protein [Candidatus Lokiarchaeota archaeon]
MSLGKIEGNYFKNVQNSLISDELAIFADCILQKSTNFESESYKKALKNDFDLDLEKTDEYIIDNYFNMIKEIHFILKNSADLTQNQKFAYCNSQRFFMKLYLQRISKKIEI